MRESGEKQSGHLLSLTCDRALIGKAADRVSCKRATRALAKNQQKSITSRFVNLEFAADPKVLSAQICQRRTHCRCNLAPLKVPMFFFPAGIFSSGIGTDQQNLM